MPAPSTSRVVEVVLLVLGGLAFLGWFFETPNFHNVMHEGLEAVTRRGGTEVLIFFGLPVMGLLQLTLAAAVGSGMGGVAVTVLGWVLVALDVVGGVGAALLFMALSNFNMH